MNETILAKAKAMQKIIAENHLISQRLKLQRMDDTNPMKKHLVSEYQKQVEQFEDPYELNYHLFGANRQEEIYG